MGHCEHCQEGCGNWSTSPIPHRDDEDRCEWRDGCCPYCTERERIKKWCEDQLAKWCEDQLAAVPHGDDRLDGVAHGFLEVIRYCTWGDRG